MPYKDPKEQAQWYRTRLKRRLKAGLCRCGRQKIDGKSSCEACTQASALYIRKQRLANTGFTPEQYDQQWLAQDGLCAICGLSETTEHAGTPKMLAADHDHATGTPRGLLCTRCNTGLGYFQDQPDRLEAAVAYLRRFSVP